MLIKMLSDDIIMPILLPFASSGVLSRKNNGKSADDLKAWRLYLHYKDVESYHAVSSVSDSSFR